jgi:hypothetical protein
MHMAMMRAVEAISVLHLSKAQMLAKRHEYTEALHLMQEACRGFEDVLDEDPVLDEGYPAYRHMVANYELGSLFYQCGDFVRAAETIQKLEAIQSQLHSGDDKSKVIGTAVMVQGLEASARFNGRTGRVQRWLEEGGRFVIELDGDGTEIKIRPEKLAQSTSYAGKIRELQVANTKSLDAQTSKEAAVAQSRNVDGMQIWSAPQKFDVSHLLGVYTRCSDSPADVARAEGYPHYTFGRKHLYFNPNFGGWVIHVTFEPESDTAMAFIPGSGAVPRGEHEWGVARQGGLVQIALTVVEMISSETRATAMDAHIDTTRNKWAPLYTLEGCPYCGLMGAEVEEDDLESHIVPCGAPQAGGGGG